MVFVVACLLAVAASNSAGTTLAFVEGSLVILLDSTSSGSLLSALSLAASTLQTNGWCPYCLQWKQ
ncbi:unnamed protein product [Cuscuta epithymum]|uniref:Secreted protein n=1 Tax=Cuscuta epithymum TaxID=186058 RepID=A0AAV0DP17_9ASTE|nr:unnamed protein product [Cuscuta epithymum]